MGIKNRKPKAIFNSKKEKPLKTNNSLSYKLGKKKIIESKNKNLRKPSIENFKEEKSLDSKPIKLSKEFKEFREKGYSSNLESKAKSNYVEPSSFQMQNKIIVSSFVNKSNNNITNNIVSKPSKSIENKPINNLIKEQVIKSQVANRPKTISRAEKISPRYSKNPKLNQYNILKLEDYEPYENLTDYTEEKHNKLIETLRQKEVINLKDKPNKNSKKNLVLGNLKANMKENIDNGISTDDIGIKSISEIKTNIDNISIVSNEVLSLNKPRINGKIKRNFTSRKIRSGVKKEEPLKNLLVKSKRKEAVIKNVYENKAKEKVVKAHIETIKKKLIQFGELNFTKLLLGIPLLLLLLMTILTIGNGNVTTSTSFVILTTNEQNEAYLNYYEELKSNLENEIQDLIINSTHDDVIVYGLGPDDKLYDLDFTEWLAILTVKIKQDFKLSSYEYKYLEEIFNKMIYYETHVEKHTSKDSEGNRETTTTLVITIHNKSYEEIKDSLNFDSEQLEWVERLIEYDSLADRIENIPTNAGYVGSSGNLSPEEIEKYGGKMVHPLNGLGRISSHYGYRIHPIFKTRKFHSGLDLAANYGTPIYAAQDGVVIHSGNKGGYGQTIMIQHDNGVTTLYAHCSSLVVKNGPIKKGEHIANVGSTGNSNGNHLHFEVRTNDGTVNPLNFINH